MAALPLSAHASPASEVASAFDEGDKFDIHMSVDYQFEVRRASIKREFSGFAGVMEGDPLPIAKDLLFKGTRHQLTPKLELGLFRDISINVGLPIVIRDSRTLEFDQSDTPCVFPGGGGAATCINADNSTTVRDGILPATGFDSDDPGGPGFTDPGDPTIFRSPTRAGLDQVHLGLAWAAMNQARDDTKPTWKIGAEVRLAVGAVQRFDADDPGSATGVSRGLHEVHLWTSMAKRMSFVEPRFRLWYIAPFAQRDNSLFVDYGFGQTSKDPQQRAGTEFGLEAVLWQDKADQQRVALDVGADLTAFFEGRAYTEMWEVFALAGRAEANGPLVLDSDPETAGVQQASYPGVTNVENHMRFGSQVGVTAELGPHVRLGLGFRLVFDQQHLITFADAGKDGPDSGDLVDPNSDEVNPGYVEIIDLVGRRYRLEDAVNYVGQVSARVLF
ncbi:MAG: hypothetical protein KJO07_21405 [Deltaproteobacteria bacterium]|nr:hypothetical protein [Deltaproteobacteria bacterium]